MRTTQNFKSVMNKVAMTLSLAVFSASVFAQASLENIRISPQGSDQLQIQFDFDQPVTNFTDKLKYQPNQLFLNFPQTSSALSQNMIPVERLGIQDINVSPKNLGLDVSVNLQKLMPYRIQQDGSHINVTLGQSLANADVPSNSLLKTSVSKQPITAPNDNSVSNPGVINSIEHVDFKRGKNGQGQLLVNLKTSAAAVEVNSRGSHVLASFKATDINPALIALMDVNDFNTPVSQVDVKQSGSNVTFDLATKGGFSYKYDQSGSLFIIEVSPPARNTAKVANTKKYQGNPISLNFQDVPVRTVLQLIADFNKLNLVTSDTVAGNITLRLDGVPWDQALDTVLRVKGLDKRLEGNILLVAPAAQIANQEKQLLEDKQKVADLAPLITEYVQINYAKGADVAKLLADDKTRLLSPRGAVSVDSRTNTLLVKDTAETIDHIKDMIKVLDIPVKQVLIEARMVTVTDNAEEALGVRWGVSNTAGNTQSSGSLEGIDAGSSASIDDRLNVNLAAAPSSGNAAKFAVKLGSLGNNLLDLELSALETENKVEIISSPRVVTANQKEALIEQGYEIPYNENSSSGATSVSFKKAVLSLKVTPQITPDNNVILNLNVTQDDIYQSVSTGTGNALALTTQAINTQVLVKNGETLVLGGIFNRTVSKTVNKVPVLGDIPGLGVLFRNTTNTNTKKELLIFVTPKIVTGNL